MKPAGERGSLSSREHSEGLCRGGSSVNSKEQLCQDLRGRERRWRSSSGEKPGQSPAAVTRLVDSRAGRGGGQDRTTGCCPRSRSWHRWADAELKEKHLGEQAHPTPFREGAPRAKGLQVLNKQKLTAESTPGQSASAAGGTAGMHRVRQEVP